MAAVARMILPSENDVVPQVLESVLAMPPTTHVAVRHVGLRLVGELAEWMDQQPQYLDRVLNWLLAGLQVAKTHFRVVSFMSFTKKNFFSSLNPLSLSPESMHSVPKHV